jgi:mRNA-degrading endonuclease RelE of RelBE toxin-antitoxin system
MSPTSIIEVISLQRFKDIILTYKDYVTISPHALDRLSDTQRKVFKEKELTKPLIAENPRGVGLQRNGRFVAFFKRKSGYLKIVFEVKEPKLEIITFMTVDSMPNLGRIKHEAP